MKSISKKFKYTVGIDEVGRGPIAGPVAVGAFVFLEENVKKIFRKVKESKQLSEKQREEWFDIIQAQKKLGGVDFAVTFQSEKIIDTKGLSFAIRTALKKSLGEIIMRSDLTLGEGPTSPLGKVLLDGGLKAPLEFTNQKTIIKGDEKEVVIALASICAKVTRDRKMRQYAKKFPEYGFDVHKGYGTRKHYEVIKKNGLTEIHRRSFLKGIK